MDGTTGIGVGGHAHEHAAHCPRVHECSFGNTVRHSPVLMLRYKSLWHFCQGGDDSQCALARIYEAGGHPAANLMPTGEFDSSLTGRPTRVVIVDETPMFRMLKEGMVSRAVHGIEIHGVGGVVEALDVLRTHEADLVITNYNMPELSGGDLIREVRQHARTRNVPVIVLSSDPNPDVREACIKAGRVRWIPKSSDHEPFNAAVRDILLTGNV
jgi:CheY-like chemotaxis protein